MSRKLYEYAVEGIAFTSLDSREIREPQTALYCIGKSGLIEKIITKKEPEFRPARAEYKQAGKLTQLRKGQYLLPGFSDLHVHAPQWGQAGTGLDVPLNEWLEKYTFHLESRFSDLAYAQNVYQNLVERLLRNGTTTVMYYGSYHKEATYKLAAICAKRGQRAFVGKVVMDDKIQNPDFCRDQSTEAALQDTEDFIQQVNQLNRSTKQGVYPVVSPRFIPSCTDEALYGLGKLAEKYGTYIQTHCSEGDWEHEYVRKRCKKSDAEALNGYGLMNNKSVMGHCGHLSDSDAGLFHAKGAIISHCPHSNVYFAGAVTPIKKFLYQDKIKVALGTDLSGGFSPSLYDTIKQAVMSSHMLESGVNPKIKPQFRGVADAALTLKEGFYLATAGAGEALGMPIGRLEEGYAWDAQLIDTRAAAFPLPIFDAEESLDIIFQKILYLSTPANIKSVWVQGEKVV